TPTSARHNNIIIIHHASILSNKKTDTQTIEHALVDPTQIAYDNSYAYRGLNESQATNKDNPYPTHLGTSPRYHAK
ncbi:MAG: hypothetical protein E7E22_09300, partial [Actinomyces sp.]|nr:hypothetical protein [Actinomyces sp.]